MATAPDALPKEGLLLLYCEVDVKALFDQGKAYVWPRPGICPRCSCVRLWGHGYAERYFEGFDEPLWVKRYRCPDCRAVHTCRPHLFMARQRYSVVAVLMSLLQKILQGRWLKCISHQAQLWWYRSVQRWCSQKQIVIVLTVSHLRQYLAGCFASDQSAPLRL